MNFVKSKNNRREGGKPVAERGVVHWVAVTIPPDVEVAYEEAYIGRDRRVLTVDDEVVLAFSYPPEDHHHNVIPDGKESWREGLGSVHGVFISAPSWSMPSRRRS